MLLLQQLLLLLLLPLLLLLLLLPLLLLLLLLLLILLQLEHLRILFLLRLKFSPCIRLRPLLLLPPSSLKMFWEKKRQNQPKSQIRGRKKESNCETLEVLRYSVSVSFVVCPICPFAIVKRQGFAAYFVMLLSLTVNGCCMFITFSFSQNCGWTSTVPVKFVGCRDAQIMRCNICIIKALLGNQDNWEDQYLPRSFPRRNFREKGFVYFTAKNRAGGRHTLHH